MEFLAVMQKCEFGDRFRRVLFLTMISLVLFHLFCLFAPFLGFPGKLGSYLSNASNALSNLTVALVLMFLLVEGQRNLYYAAARRRARSYEAISDQIISWFRATGSKLFTPEVVQPEASSFLDALQNFKVVGSSESILRVFPQFTDMRALVMEYCRSVHFELTNYPAEMLYGIHFEFDRADLNQQLCQALRGLLQLEAQSRDFAIDHSVPKRAEWIFLTRTICFPEGQDAGFATNLTHVRHFVELVGHAYETVYGEAMLSIFLAKRIGGKPSFGST